jgi:hypothetical protein
MAYSMTEIFAKTKYTFYNTLMGMLIMLGMSLLLIPSNEWYGGAVGAAIALTCMRIALSVIYYLESHFIFGISPVNPKVYKSVIAGAVSLLSIYLISLAFPQPDIFVVLASLVAFFAVYLASLLVLRGFEKDDVMMLGAIEKKLGVRMGLARRVARKFV